MRKKPSNPESRTALTILMAAFALGASQQGIAQGCVASRGTCMTPGHSHSDLGGGEAMPPSSGFQVAVGYRWLHSDRMFSGDVEQTARQAEGSQEINDSHFMDLGVTYAFTPRFSATLTLPYSVHDRSQVVRAVNIQRTILDRFHTHSSGIGDVRIEGNAWLLNPETHMSGNVLLGLGLSAPTGDRDVQDTFKIPFRRTPLTEVHAVDQSIQLGNGGWGVVLDIYAYQQLMPRLGMFFNGSYTVTPEEKYTPTASLSGDYSIADSYLARGGFEFLLWPKYSLSFNVAGRIEGVPVRDIVGGSDGFRRSGYAVSLEPGVSVSIKSWSVSVTAPIALYRNRTQSISESAALIAPVAAGFADYVLTCGITKRF